MNEAHCSRGGWIKAENCEACICFGGAPVCPLKESKTVLTMLGAMTMTDSSRLHFAMSFCDKGLLPYTSATARTHGYNFIFINIMFQYVSSDTSP